MQLADAIWTATALLHQENPSAKDFAVHEIVSRVVEENLVNGFRPGLQPHASWHCVANKKPNGGQHRMLFETTRGRRRLVRTGDSSHPDRNGKFRPLESDVPASLQPLLNWYDQIYLMHSGSSAASSHQFPPETFDQNRNFTGFEGMQSTKVFLGHGGTIVLPERLQRELRLKEGTCLSIFREKDRVVMLPITEDFIGSLRGRLKGKYSLLEDREREHRIEKNR